MAGSKGHRGHGRVRETPPKGHAPAPTPKVAGVLLDTDIIIEALRARPRVSQAVRTIIESRTPAFCTAITLAEIFAGLRKGEESATEAFLGDLGIVILDGEIGRKAGSYIARYGRSHGLEVADAMIAAAASCSGLSLWTMNRRHFPMTDVEFYPG